MLPYPLSKIDEAIFQELCDQRTSESDTLDFKQTLPGKEDDDKEELAKDVSALLNAGGGDLVYGISEDRTTGTAKAVLPIVLDNFDKESRRIAQILDAWIEPRFHGIQIAQVQLTGGSGVVIRVPSSYDGPHCVRNPNSAKRRFVMRNGRMTSDMSYDQIRNAFDRTATLADRARQFIDKRLAKVLERRTPRPMDPVPICVAEFVPLAGIAGRAKVDVAKLHSGAYGALALPIWRYAGMTRSLNIDGLIVHPAGLDAVNAMTHIFRDGCFESMMIGGGAGAREGQNVIWSKVVTDFIHQAAEAAIYFAKISEISGPSIIRFALMHVDDHIFATKNSFFNHGPATADRNNLIFPEIYIEDISVDIDIKELVAPTIEVLWQAFDFEKAQNQD